ncbi:MAG: D-lyxose/D-mannose family sugar isomerase [Calditrichaeota bacterium]|nr:D-lyxose/D-mannose family sugar isomerase [Calditrichota bacterium]
MKRSEINRAIKQAMACFERNGWHLPPNPRWDVTDAGLGDFKKYGLVLVNLAEEDEYCEKLMYGVKNQRTPAHCHRQKKEDIICRNGELAIQVWNHNPNEKREPQIFQVKINGEMRDVRSGDIIHLKAGERITLVPGVYHEFWPESEECIIGEVSSHNDDLHDNFFANPDVGRFPEIEEDEPPFVKLVNEL